MALFWRAPAPPAPVVRSQVLMPSAPFSVGSSSYADVQVSSMESGLQSIAIHSTVDLICSLVSELPIDTYRKARSLGEPQAQIDTPSWILDPDASGYGAEDWMYRALESFLLRGNLLGQVGSRAAPQQGAYPTQIELLHPDKVRGNMEDGQAVWYLSGQRIPPESAYHRRVFPIPGVVLGLSPIAQHARSLNLDLTMTQFGLQFFQDGGMPGAVLSNSEEPIEDESYARRIKSVFMMATRGNREPAVLGRGWKYDPIEIKPEEGQFLATRQMSGADCCRIYGPGFAEILGYESSTKGGSLTYANLQSREAHILVFSVSRWIRRIERVLSGMLPSTQIVKLNRNALLETTTIERFQAYALALGGQAWMAVDEIRQLEELPPHKIEQPAAPKAPAAGGSGSGGSDSGGSDSGGGGQ